MNEPGSRYYAAELEERLATLGQIRNHEFMSSALILQLAAVTLLLPIVALLIGWSTL